MRLIVFLLLFSVVLPALSKNPSENATFEKGRQAFESGQYTRALDLFSRTIKGSPKSVRNKAYYYQGLALFELGLFYSSYISFRNVLVQADSSNQQIYEKAIKNAVIIADRLGVVERAGKALSKLPGNFIPNSIVDMSHYALGIHHYYMNDSSKAASHLKSVHPESKFYFKALFHLGILATEQKNYKEAIFYFAKIVELTRGKKEFFSIAEVSRLNLARSVYAAGDIEKSIEIYSRFLSSSPFWLTVLFEASWPLMRVDDTTVSLGNLHTILSPFYQEELVGEGHVLRATILFKLCKYEEMRRTLDQFFKIYDSVMRQMNAEKSKLSSSEAFFNAYMEKSLNRAFMSYMDRDLGVQSKLKVLGMLREEKQNLSKFRQNEQMRKMMVLIDKAEKNLIRQVGSALMNLHKRKLVELLEQREQANYLKVEIVTGEKEMIEGQRGLPPKRVVDVETSVAEGYRFWPFFGEYWEDELGAYVYTTESACVN